MQGIGLHPWLRWARGQGKLPRCSCPTACKLFSQAGVGLSPGFLSCLSCGYVWTRLAPDQLRHFIRTNGDELVKQCLDFLEHGPDHDLPDVPKARLAGLGVAEIDALVLAGHLPAATRRLRELTGRTWDEVVNAMRYWRGLKRPQKLEILGWVSKERSRKMN